MSIGAAMHVADTARADSEVLRAFDRWLLDYDAVFAASVESFVERKTIASSSAPPASTVVNVRLSNIVAATSRWPQPPSAFWVRGRMDSNEPGL